MEGMSPSFFRGLGVALTLLALAVGTTAAAAPVRVAVLANRPAADVLARWQPLIHYLNGQVPGYRFHCEVLGYAELETAIQQRTVDFVLTNPSHYMLMTYRNGLSSPLATLIPVEHGRVLARFGGVIFSRADFAGAPSLEKLRGLTIATATKGSLGGYQAQAVELIQAGLHLPQDVRLLETGMPQDLAVKAVMEGRADVGFVRTGVLEDLSGKGELDLRGIRVIGQKTAEGFPLLLSTRLYPEWPFAAMPGVDEDLARQVAGALLSLPHGSRLARRMDIEGFTIRTDYEQVRAALETLRLPPFDFAPEFTAEDIWNKYRWQLAGGSLLFAVIAALTLSLFFLNRRLAEEHARLHRSSEEWRRLLTALGEGVYGVDADGRCTFINPAAAAMLGFSAVELLGRDQHALFHYRREDGTAYPEDECPIALTLKDGQPRYAEDWFWHKDGSGFPVMLTTALMEDDGRRKGAVVVFRDISDRRQLESRLREEATTDHLTGVANRRLFLKQLEMELDRFKRFGESAALLMADLDYFKKINDSYGHAAGDGVLRHFADISRQYLRRVDLIGRLGGEEFGILLPGTDAASALQFADRYRCLVESSPAPGGDGNIGITVSIGIAEFASSDDTVETILARADAALYGAKAGGRNTVRVVLLGDVLPPEDKPAVVVPTKDRA
jgi:diguanylate cyclase (GGDEF)-like protein/PAS domain S-box-containing protein